MDDYTDSGLIIQYNIMRVSVPIIRYNNDSIIYYKILINNYYIIMRIYLKASTAGDCRASCQGRLVIMTSNNHRRILYYTQYYARTYHTYICILQNPQAITYCAVVQIAYTCY